MGFEFLRKRQEYVDVDSQYPKKPNKWIIIAIVVAIAILAFDGIGGKNEDEDLPLKGKGKEYTTESYIAENEAKLEKILATIQGAGRVKVMMTVESMGEKMVAVDKKSENIQDNDEKKVSKTINQEQKTVLFGAGAEEQPFVINEKLPAPSGVLVVATGAGDEKVRLEIYEAVKALYGVSGHRVKVSAGSLKEK